MAGNEGLFKALQIFQKGMKDLGGSIALIRANKAVRDVREDVELGEQEKTDRLRELADSLPGFLAASGVDAAKIQAVTAQFKQAAPPKTSFEAFQRGGQFRERAIEFEQAKAGRGFGAVREKARITEQAKAPGKIEDLRAKAVEKFKADPIIKKNRDKLLAVSNIRGLREAEGTKDLVLTFNILRRNLLQIAGEKGRFTDRDVADVSPDPSVRGKFLELFNKAIDGTTPENFGERIDEISTALEAVALKDIKKLAKGNIKGKFKRIQREAKRAGIELDFSEEDLVNEALEGIITTGGGAIAPPAKTGKTREVRLKDGRTALVDENNKIVKILGE